MLKELVIRNYQSHADTHIKLGGLTVLVGPSNSGKSAVTRAIKALASNQTGKDFISHGESTMQVQAVTDKGTITLTKGKPEDSYVILRNDDPQNPIKLTKMGVTAPQAVTDFLGIEPKDAINFAGQFDMPYLLKTSAPEVARTLGELTNVSSIFEASRESLRRKMQFSSTLKTRESDLEALAPRLLKFENLPERIQAVSTAEMFMEAAVTIQRQIQRLNDLLFTIQTATSRLKAATTATEAPLPDVQDALGLHARLNALDGLIAALREATQKKTAATSSIEANSAIIEELDIEYSTILQQALICPTCQQSTEGVHAHA